jgi:phenylalanyl-tRNA synthetase beta subunit
VTSVSWHYPTDCSPAHEPAIVLAVAIFQSRDILRLRLRDGLAEAAKRLFDRPRLRIQAFKVGGTFRRLTATNHSLRGACHEQFLKVVMLVLACVTLAAGIGLVHSALQQAF